MTPGIPQPDPVQLAAPPLVFAFLLILTFTLHLLPMSAVLGGSIIGAFSRWQGARGRAHHMELARLTGKLLPVAIAAAVTLGVAALLFLQVIYGRVFFSSSVVLAWAWIAVVPLLIVAYYAAYAVAFDRSGAARIALAWLAAAAFMVIAFIYTNNMSLMLRPDAQHALYAESARGFQWNAGDRTLLPRYLHMLAGAIAIGGLAVATIGLIRRRVSAEFGKWAVAYGCRWFVVATAANVAIGVWFLFALPPAVSALFLGGDARATVTLALGLVAAAGAFWLALRAARSREPGRLLASAWGATLLTLALMVLTRDTVRRTMLEAAGFQPATWAAPQWGPMVIFAVLLVVAIALLAWMLIVLLRAPAQATVPRDVLSV